MKKLVLSLASILLLAVLGFGIAKTITGSSKPIECDNPPINIVGEAESTSYELPILSFYSNSGTGKMNSIVVNYGDYLPKNNYIKEGYSFVGWSETSDGNVKYANEEVYLALESGAITTLYAIWTKDVENLWVTSYPLFQDIWGGFLERDIKRTIQLVLAEEFVFSEYLTINATGKILVYAQEIPLVFECDIRKIDDFVLMLNESSESEGISYSRFLDTNIIVGNYFSIDKILAENCLFENGAYITKDKTTLIRYLGNKDNNGEYKNADEYVIPANISNIGMYAFAETTLKKISCEDGSKLSWVGYGAFKDSSLLANISLPNEVSFMGGYAFAGTAISTISLPANLKSIGSYAFNNCLNLANITLPKALAVIDNSVFYECPSLISVQVSNENQNFKSVDGVLFNKEGTELILYPINKIGNTYKIPQTTKIIADYAFSHTQNLQQLTLSENIISIGKYAFRNSSPQLIFETNVLESIGEYAFYEYEGDTISLPATILDIENHAFEGAVNLTSVQLNEQLSAIGEYAFAGCQSLQTLNIPDSAVFIGKYAFSGITSPVVFSANSQITTLHEYSFAEYLGETFTLPTNVDTLEIFTFNQCTSNISFENNVALRTIGKFAFSGYSGTSLELPEEIESFGFGAFYNANSLANINIPSLITEIPDYAFAYCKKLESIILPEGTTLLGESSFMGCISLTNIDLPQNVKTLSPYCFKGITADILFSDSPSIEKIGKGAFSGYKGSNFIIPETVTTLEMRSFEKCINFTTFSIPNTVTVIQSWAFEECANLISVTLPENLLEIKEGVFRNCKKLPTISIPKTVQSIGSSAFALCRVLVEVSFEGNNSLTTIGSGAFLGCNALPSFSIPNRVNSLGSLAFYGCNSLTEIYIPASVLDIGYLAFYGCNRLESVYMQSIEPPTLGNSALSYNSLSRKIYVPSGSIDKYSASPGWAPYLFYIFEGDE